MTCYPLGDPRNTIRNNTDLLLHHHTTGTPYTHDTHGNRTHYTTQPPLLDQLDQAVHGVTTTGGGKTPLGPAAVASLDAIACRQNITRQAQEIAAELHIPKSRTANAWAAVRALREHHYDNDDHAARHVANATSRWVTAARIITGAETPPRRIHAPCPQCATNGSLRATPSPLGAYCVECHHAWDSFTINQLGEHIRLAETPIPFQGETLLT